MKKAKQRKFAKPFFFMSLFFWFAVVSLSGKPFAAPADFPKKEITIIESLGAGGGRDILARGVGRTMSRHLGVPMVVMNIVGAGGARGLISLFHSAPDGYTIGVGTTADIINQILEKQDYDCRRFIYIGNVQHGPPTFFVRSDSPFRSVKDFKSFGKVVRFGASSFASTNAVAAMLLSNREGFPLVIVGGYKGAADVMLGLIRGEFEFGSCAPSVALQYLKTGQVRPILTVDNKRTHDFPDTPSLAEIGQPDLAVFATSYWFMAPPGVSRDRIQMLENALAQTMKDPEFLKWAKEARVELKPLNGEETTKTVLRLFELLERYKGDIEKHTKY